MKYQVGKPVYGDLLIGRDQEVKLIKHLLLSGQSVAIIAPRRMGKTSLMLEIIRQIQDESSFIVNVDVFSTPDIASLAKRISESVFSNRQLDKYFRLALTNIAEAFKNIRFKSEIEDYSFILEFNSKAKTAPFELLEDSLKLIDHYAKKHQKQILAAFDEFGDIKKLDGEHIVKLFRSIVQHQENSSFLFTGSYESVMNELFVQKSAPFYRMTRIIELGPIDHEPFLNYMMNFAQKKAFPVKKTRINEILDFTKGHPYYTQLYWQELWIQYQLSNKKEILSHQQMIDQLLLMEKNFLEKTWESYSSKKEEKQILIQLAQNSKNLYTDLKYKGINISRGINQLKNQGLVKHDKETYILTDPLFQEWLLRNVVA